MALQGRKAGSMGLYRLKEGPKYKSPTMIQRGLAPNEFRIRYTNVTTAFCTNVRMYSLAWGSPITTGEG